MKETLLEWVKKNRPSDLKIIKKSRKKEKISYVLQHGDILEYPSDIIQT
jgi:hypothetical protein